MEAAQEAAFFFREKPHVRRSAGTWGTNRGDKNLCCGGERFHVAELSEDAVLVVVIDAREYDAILVASANLTRFKFNSATRWRQSGEGAGVCALDSELGDHVVSGLDVRRGCDLAVREGGGPFLDHLSEFVS